MDKNSFEEVVEKLEGVIPGSIIIFFPDNLIQFKQNSTLYQTVPSEVHFRIEALFGGLTMEEGNTLKLTAEGYGDPNSPAHYGKGPLLITGDEMISGADYWEVVGFEVPYMSVNITEEKEKRISRSKLFMEIAKLLSDRSTCSRAKVGSLLVKDNRIISTGYNGAPSGLPHCVDVGCEIGPLGGCIRAVHSEANCVSHAAKNGIPTDGTTLYVTLSPCIDCAKLLINAGIKEVVYLNEYRNTAGIDLLKRVGIKVTKYREN
jgi:dCMP deaminase